MRNARVWRRNSGFSAFLGRVARRRCPASQPGLEQLFNLIRVPSCLKLNLSKVEIFSNLTRAKRSSLRYFGKLSFRAVNVKNQ